MAWFKKTKGQQKIEKKVKIPEGLWVKCENCKEIVYKKEIDKNLRVCPKCNYHFRISARERLKLMADEGSFVETSPDITPADPLAFRDSVPYKERIRDNQKSDGGGHHGFFVSWGEHGLCGG
jgi:acetyl-CoA carboxylase carboxyl transferase subunit beta